MDDPFDIVVAGGSCTGVFAAIRAAEAGCRVALVEAAGGFGGTATQGLVPIWHSLFSSDGRTPLVGGLTNEVERELVRRGEARMEAPDNPARGALLNVAGLQMLLDELVAAQPRITPFLHTRLAAAMPYAKPLPCAAAGSGGSRTARPQRAQSARARASTPATASRMASGRCASMPIVAQLPCSAARRRKRSDG